MRINTSIVQSGLAALLLAATLAAGCSKEPVDAAGYSRPAARITDPVLIEKIQGKVGELPGIGIYNRRMDKVIVFKDLLRGGRSFNFVDPSATGINFATSNGGQWTWSESQGIMVLSQPSAGLGAGGGTVVAGNASLDIGFAMCFAFNEQGLGMDLFNTGINDVAGVVGIAGDLEGLMNGEFSAGDDLFQYFHGFAYYLVYAEQLANTGYEVLNWVDELDQDPADLDGFGFSFVVSFQNEGGIYISRDGELTVNNGSIGFNGNYFAIEGVGFFDGSGADGDYSVVPGFGTMGCQ